MQIELRELRVDDAEVAIRDSLELPEVVSENHQVFAIDPVEVNATVTRKGQTYRALGNLKSCVTYVCSRCLEPFTADLQTELDEIFTDEENDSFDPENEVHLVTNGVILLDPYIKQAVDLALDYRPLCDIDCKGLCQKCGTNLNRSSCECDTRTIDPRLAMLEDLILKDESE